MPPVPQVLVVLVTWNCEEDLVRCLEALRLHTRYPRWRLLIIDNGSTDGTRALLAEHAADAEIVLLDDNRGWVASLNLALRRFAADYYFFLNPDAFVQPSWLQPLIDAMGADDRIGFASPKFLYADGTIHYAGLHIGPSLSPRVERHGLPDAPGDDAVRPVAFAHGMCLLRQRVVAEVGLYDEGYGLGYFEEFDYQLRARRCGFSAVYVPESVIVHATSRSFDKHVPGYKRTLQLRNWLRLISTHWPLEWLFLRLPIELAYPVRAALRGEGPEITLRAWGGWLSMLGEIRRRRWALRREGPLDFRLLRGARGARDRAAGGPLPSDRRETP
jgi:GT2 family glycosyltransferase